MFGLTNNVYRAWLLLWVVLAGTPGTPGPLTAKAQDTRGRIRAPSLRDGVPQPVINEFMANNESVLADGDGRFSDWIELYNPFINDLDLSQFYLTDDATRPRKWPFPVGTTLASGEYLILFASGKSQGNHVDGAGYLHTTFKLGANGEYLAVIAPDGTTVIQAFAPLYPEQYPDISYSQAGYFTTPTPGSRNNLSPVQGFVADTEIYPKRGCYPNESHPDVPVWVTIHTPTPGARTFYTTDGSEPSPVHGRLYNDPIPVFTTTVLRAAAFKGSLAPTPVNTHTYLFLTDVIHQSNRPTGYPLDWAGHPADYEMDPEVVTDPRYADEIEQSLRAFPSLSIACKPESVFGADGLYQNPQNQGSAWERPISVELITANDEEPGFHVNAGLRIQGGSSRNPDTPKHSFSLRFRKQYGTGTLDYPLFHQAPSGNTAVERFDFLQLRSGYNFGWTHRHYYQCRHAQYNRDQWTNDLFLAMGHPASHGRWVHLYLNGLYWGIYHLHERPDQDFMASYLGGTADEYDVLNSGSATAGDKNAWNTMMSIAQGNLADPLEYTRIQTYLHIDSLIDYIILNCYIGNLDWDGHNWRTARQQRNGAQFRFFPWDSEFAISPNGPGGKQNPGPLSNALHVNRTAVNGQGRPSALHQRLTLNPQYRLRFADRIHLHLFQNGALSAHQAEAIWRHRSQRMDRAIIAESARWGDFRRDVEAPSWAQTLFDLYTRDDHYLPDQAYILGTYLPQRTHIVLAQFRAQNLYPALDAPYYGQSQAVVSPGHALSIHNPNNTGQIYYSLNGTDPHHSAPIRASRRLPGAMEYTGEIVLTQTTQVKARVFDGQLWSALASTLFIVGTPAGPGNLVISELFYHPPGATEDTEFVELVNLSTDETIDLTGVRLHTGIDFTFAPGATLAPGERILVVGDLVAFGSQYGADLPIAGRFQGNLDNSGQSLRVTAYDGTDIDTVSYDDQAPWPASADGQGYSLVRILTAPPGKGQSSTSWTISNTFGGSPGS
jgi:hypothetical protein